MSIKFLKPADIAKRWNISVHTIYREINNGNLPATRIAGSFRVKDTDVERYERERRTDVERSSK